MPVGPVHGGEELVGKFVGEGGVRKEAVPGLFDPGKSLAHLSSLDVQVAGVRQGREEEKRRRLDRPVETGEVKILNDPDPLRPIPQPLDAHVEETPHRCGQGVRAGGQILGQFLERRPQTDTDEGSQHVRIGKRLEGKGEAGQ